jgi:cytochrome d ubiquinol oxidase subunit I
MTRDAVADVPAPMVMGTLIAYLAVYGALTVAYIGVLTYLARKQAKGDPVPTFMVPTSSAATVPGE